MYKFIKLKVGQNDREEGEGDLRVKNNHDSSPCLPS